MQKIIEFISVLFAALIMGVFWGTWFTLTRSLPDFSAAEFIHIGNVIIANVALPMSILMPASLLLMLIATWRAYRGNRPSFYFYLLAFLLMVASLIITVVVEVPIDNQIKTWTETTVPANWQMLRLRWEQYHTMRTFASIVSVVFFILGLIRRIR